ncbi:MAG: arginine--tRNA ligase [Candidatus Wallbacteria bacterium]|nr:arginine--tRNA ligase [Candidatus Wallbacteria bacterium]
MEVLLQSILSSVGRAFPCQYDAQALCEIPKSGFGDLAWPCFTVSKELKRPPQQIAEGAAESLNQDEALKSAGVFSVNGGYLNFRFHDAAILKEIFAEDASQGSRFGYRSSCNIRTVVEYSSPNIAKPFGIGHLRSTSIGHALANIMAACGHTVISVNHLGDWGTQFGKLVYAFRNWGDEQKLSSCAIQHLFELYVKFHSEAEAHPELEDCGREEFQKLEEGDADNRALWQRFCDMSLTEFKRIYARLGVDFDHYTGESFYIDRLGDTIGRLDSAGLLKESDGAWIVDLTEFGLPPALMRKSDGATLYLTRDLAAAIYRREFLKADYILYVVGSEQKLHFQQLKAVIKKLGYDWHDRVIHIDFGLFRFSGEKMSTRKGKVIFMEDVLNEAARTVQEIIAEKNPDLKNRDAVAEKVGVAGILFGDLVNERIKNVTFDWEKMLNFEGDTGPYVEYAHSRCMSILKKAGEAEIREIRQEICLSPVERDLLREIFVYYLKIEKAGQQYKPHFIAESMLQISRNFNRFYTQCPVLKIEDEALRSFRLSLVNLTADVIEGGLGLLGIAVPGEM